MKCDHCMFACAPGSGSHMPYETAKKALRLARDYQEYITIGGGEPTLHPNFIEIIAYASFISQNCPFLVTNGTCSKETWDTLMFASKAHLVMVNVSKDPWHNMEMVKDYVWDDADKYKLWWGNNGVRQIVPKGRAAANPEELKNEAMNYMYDLVEIKDDCIDVRVDPSGIIWVDGKVENYRIGELSEENLEKALELKFEKENEEYE